MVVNILSFVLLIVCCDGDDFEVLGVCVCFEGKLVLSVGLFLIFCLVVRLDDCVGKWSVGFEVGDGVGDCLMRIELDDFDFVVCVGLWKCKDCGIFWRMYFEEGMFFG